jgi:hypothetical protein
MSSKGVRLRRFFVALTIDTGSDGSQPRPRQICVGADRRAGQPDLDLESAGGQGSARLGGAVGVCYCGDDG